MQRDRNEIRAVPVNVKYKFDKVLRHYEAQEEKQTQMPCSFLLKHTLQKTIFPQILT